MSMTPNPNQSAQPQTVTPDPLGVGAPPVVVAGGSSKQPIPREVTGVIPALKTQVPLTQRTNTGKYLYSGTYLANAQGQVYRSAYDPQADPVIELAKLQPTDSVALRTELYQRGFYDGKSRPTGTDVTPQDVKAMQNFLLTANTYGYDWQTSLNFVRQEFPITGSGGSGRKATSAIDLGKALQDESFAMLGRKLSKEELQQAISSVQSKEASTNTSTSTLVQMAPQQADPTQAQAYGFTRAADIVSQMLRNGG
jgi:hypothetical protein